MPINTTLIQSKKLKIPQQRPLSEKIRRLRFGYSVLYAGTWNLPYHLKSLFNIGFAYDKKLFKFD
jgi:hypothetical protein